MLLDHVNCSIILLDSLIKHWAFQAQLIGWACHSNFSVAVTMSCEMSKEASYATAKVLMKPSTPLFVPLFFLLLSFPSIIQPLLPIEHNGPGLEYKVSYRRQDVPEDWKEHMVKRHSFVVKNTPTFVPYEIKIQARNHQGWGPEPKITTGFSGEDCEYQCLLLTFYWYGWM